MITLQYVNDLAVACADNYLKNGYLEITDLMKRVLKNNANYENIFVLEFNNRVGNPLLSLATDFV